MPWWVWYNVQSGKPAQVIQAASAGDVQSKTGFPPLSGPYKTRAAAQAAIPGSTTPGTPAGAVKDIASSLNPLAGLFQKAIWIRVAEVVAGLILLGIGLNAMLKGKPMSAVTKTAGVAGKAAML